MSSPLSIDCQTSSHCSSRSFNASVSEKFFDEANACDAYPAINWGEVTTSVKSLITYLPPSHIQDYAAQLVTHRAQQVAISTLKEIDFIIDPAAEFDFPHYEPKQVSLSSFFISTDNQVFISSEKIARGGYKKVSNAVHLNTLREFVKVVVRGQEKDILNMEHDLALNELFYKANPVFIKPPSRLEDRFITITKNGSNKIIVFEPKLKDGREMLSNNLFQIAHFILGYANSLETVHQQGYIFCDGKKSNALFSGNHYSETVPISFFLNDFGLCVKQNELILNTTKKFAPPEALLLENEKVFFKPIQATVSFDCYQLGLTILNLMFPEIVSKKVVFGLLSAVERHTYFMTFNAINDTMPSTTEKEESEKKFHSKLIHIARKLTTKNPSKRPPLQFVIEHLNKFLKENSI